MEIPPKLEVLGLRPSAHLRELIATNIAKLERRYGRITSCQVAIRAPNRHHRMGEPFAVTIRLALPNRKDVDVNPPPRALDHRQGDLSFAVNDAFRRADRRLREYATKLRGEAKIHRGQPAGRVLRIDHDGQFGFLQSEDGREIYFHAHSVIGGKFDRLKPGSGVTFHEEIGEKGPQASTVRALPTRRGS